MKFHCPICSQALEADLEHTGCRISCPACSNTIVIPSQAPKLPHESTSLPGDRSEPIQVQTVLSGLAGHVSDVSGLDRLEDFSFKKMFAEVFRKHSPEEAEEHFAIGTRATTPPLLEVQTHWPNPWAFFRIISLSILLTLAFYWAIARFQNPFLIPGWIFVGCFGIPFAVLVFFIETNVLRNVSLYRVWGLLLLGGVLSLVISLSLFDLSQIDEWLGPMSAGLIEEAGKLAAVVLFTSRWRTFPWTLNGIVFGAAVGTGFSAFETAGYVFSSLGTGESFGAEITMTLRAIFSPMTHTIWTAAAAGALWRVRGGKGLSFETFFDWRFLRVFLLVVALHALWNSPLTVPFVGGMPGYVLFRAILGLVGWVIILSLVQAGIREVAAAKQNPGQVSR